MFLNEIVKNFLKEPERVQDTESSIVTPDNVIADLSNSEQQTNTGAFFDDSLNSFFEKSDITDLLYKQKDKILKYRQLAMMPDVCDAIDEIINEIIFSYDDKEPLKIEVEIDNTKLVTAITEKFEKIAGLMDVKRNLFQIVKQGYTDGQLVVHCAYDKKSTTGGLKSVKLIEPCLLFFDTRENQYAYMREDKDLMVHKVEDSKTYSIEEIVRENFGIYDKKIILSYLEYAMKPANMLKTLEDLLIPLRFSRSISRRVFNVDIGDLPNKRGTEVMRDYQTKFKYKKFYNNDTGEVSNQQHITSMVEDYWFANRSGGKGTQVDVLDETGNLGELNDILYFSRKLYRSMKIPNSRIAIDENSDHEFDHETTRTSKDDMKFFMFISRLRQVYSSLFKEILKREVVSTGVMKEEEWEDIKGDISVSFVNENKFIEKMNLDNFIQKLEIYATAQEYQGKLFSVEKILKDVFRLSDDEIKEEFTKIQKEEKDPLYAKFYQNDEEEEGKW